MCCLSIHICCLSMQMCCLPAFLLINSFDTCNNRPTKIDITKKHVNISNLTEQRQLQPMFPSLGISYSSMNIISNY